MATAFDDDSAERIVRAVRAVEGGYGLGDATPGRHGEEVVRCLVTSGTADGDGNYPGKVTLWTEGAWSDYSPVKVRPFNGETLDAGTRYACKGVAPNSAGVEVFMVLGGGGGGSPASPCDLIGLLHTDCLTATPTGEGVGDPVVLAYDEGSNKWNSGGTEMVYDDPTTGAVAFWFEGGTLHLSIGGNELLHCGGGCFRGGVITGHRSAGDAEGCSGPSFKVCVECGECPEPPQTVACCPGEEIPSTLHATITGGGACNGTYVLTWEDGPPGGWAYRGHVGTCGDETLLPKIFFACNPFPLGWRLVMSSSEHTLVSEDCSAHVWVFQTNGGAEPCGCSSGITITVTE